MRYVFTGVGSYIEPFVSVFDLPFDCSKSDEWREQAEWKIECDELQSMLVESESDLIALLGDVENGQAVLLKFEAAEKPEIVFVFSGDYPSIYPQQQMEQK